MRPIALLLLSSVCALGACNYQDQGTQSASASVPPAAAPASSDAAFVLPPSAKVPTINVALLKEMTNTLSSDAFEGRAPTTPGEEKTVAYLIAQMTKAGLKPGNKGSWTQDVPLVEVTSSPDMALSITGGREPLTLAYKTDMVAGTYQVTPRSEISDSEMVFVGYGINAPEKGWNDYAGLDARGKTVVMLVNDPDYEMEGLDGPFEGRAMTYYGRWDYKFAEAARQGAAAVLVVHDTFPAAYPWDVVVSSWTGPQLNIDLPGNHMDQAKAAGWVTLDAAKRLFASAGKDFAALSDAAKRPGFRAVPLGLRANLAFDNKIRRQSRRMSSAFCPVNPGRTNISSTVLIGIIWAAANR